MKRREIRKIIKRHYGAVTEVARRANVKLNAVSMWLGGSPNKRLGEIAEAYAIELLAKEEAERMPKGEANGPSARKMIDALRGKGSSGAE